MINKQVNKKEALNGVQNGMTFMFGGFGLCGIPENCIEIFLSYLGENFTKRSLIIKGYGKWDNYDFEKI